MLRRSSGGEKRPVRFRRKEFATRPLPIFLFGVGTALLPGRTWAGAGLLALLAGREKSEKGSPPTPGLSS